MREVTGGFEADFAAFFVDVFVAAFFVGAALLAAGFCWAEVVRLVADFVATEVLVAAVFFAAVFVVLFDVVVACPVVLLVAGARVPDFFAAVFVAAALLAVVFLAVAFVAAAFLAGVAFLADLAAVAFLAGVAFSAAAFFAGDALLLVFFAAVFFAGFLTAAFVALLLVVEPDASSPRPVALATTPVALRRAAVTRDRPVELDVAADFFAGIASSSLAADRSTPKVQRATAPDLAAGRISDSLPTYNEIAAWRRNARAAPQATKLQLRPVEPAGPRAKAGVRRPKPPDTSASP